MKPETERFVCIHGHFYQPPRENPWLESVEIQDSAAPYHDWNERITAECYAPNSASRILDGDQRIVDIVSNYAKISFNLGPTLLSWMEAASPQVYQAILNADQQSIDMHSGHGAAIAQVYNHIILPLANAADKRTQIIWGIRDFEYRFKRRPEGMWLAETAVDLETLDLLTEQGIAFTILAPHQAARFRKIGDEAWNETEGAAIDPSRAYQCRLPSGRTISLFFYDGPISRAVAFDRLLENGDSFSERLLAGFSDEREWPQLLHIATDGETYGHHQKFGDMALAAALKRIESGGLARLTNYGEYLELCPPTHEAEIWENSSWSCVHGIERWKSDCGCNSGGYPQWNQQWRAPLRAALDWLRDRLATEFSHSGAQLLKDPWLARDEYIEVILNRGIEQARQFVSRHAARPLDLRETNAALMLLEMQRHAMLMYTSCGWFFDELSGPETVQVIQYASRALQLAAGLAEFEQGLEKSFLERLAHAHSNIAAIGNGAVIYDRFVLPARVDLTKVGTHYAFSSLFKEYHESSRIFCYTVATDDYTKLSSDEATLALGRVTIGSDITGETDYLTFCVMRLGSHDFKGCISRGSDTAAYTTMRDEILSAFERGLYSHIIGLMDTHFGTHNYSLANLFRDEQRKILSAIINSTIEEFAEIFQRMYEHSRPLIEFVHESGMPVPKLFMAAAQPALNAVIKRVLIQEDVDSDTIERTIDQIGKWQVRIESPESEYFMRLHMEELMHALETNPSDLHLLGRIRKLTELIRALPNQIVLWQIQNDYYRLSKTFYPGQLRACAASEEAAAWVEAFRALGEMLHFNLAALLPEIGELR
ncbi:DUF3536 domain-containing protein [Geobacter sp. SVR]|uniref:DUF3536 domain-containing protein n=1 Tax=Geobacter sp. SVR TaxID=2495594 RepID=UPI00143EFADB|nr:DUF3536 domain-containing protein [Geobacter sp. SVR]BCS53554.1 glycoside hydrolase [Geobacter sp. SVR]GCF84249.1 glycoside hydrolase [Geobacter sp. SVR]